MLTLKDIEDASKKIKPYIHRTPLIYSNSFSRLTGANVYLKTENLQKTGSFKVRGAFNKMISINDKEVIAASMGNHAQAVAYAAGMLGIHAKIVMPKTVPIIKEEATRSYGADVALYGESFNDALNYALSQKGCYFIHAFDDNDIIAGQGTIALEVLEEIKDIDAVFVPVGGGGIISGISVAFKAISPKTEIIGVQTKSAPSAYVSFMDKKISAVPPSPTIADGIAVGLIGEKTFDIISKYVDEIMLVSEDSIAMAVLLFLERKKIVVEGAGATTLAALIENKERFRDKNVVLVVSGGNIDFTLIDRIIHKGLVTSKRIGVLKITVDDIPGRLHALTGVIASHRGNILNVQHDRLSGDLPVGKTRVIFTIEVRGETHLADILTDLLREGFDVSKI
ncbi:MAG: threonine ammonia-lyase [Nitrospirae bacterium]|nr:threonine ammonia-lyase [Nitrospirota bacterium]